MFHKKYLLFHDIFSIHILIKKIIKHILKVEIKVTEKILTVTKKVMIGGIINGYHC